MSPPRARSPAAYPPWIAATSISLAPGSTSPAADPLGADHLRDRRRLVRVDLAHVGHQLDDAVVHRVQVVDLVVRCDPDQRQRLQQRPAEAVGWILHERSAGGRQLTDRASAVALQERRHRTTGRVVGERRFHLEETDGSIGCQFVADRHAGDSAADHQDVVGARHTGASTRRNGECIGGW